MKFDNVITRKLGIKYPIIQGAIGWKGAGSSSIAVPVSEAGALGILTSRIRVRKHSRTTYKKPGH